MTVLHIDPPWFLSRDIPIAWAFLIPTWTDLLGPVTEGSQRADALAMAVQTTLQDIFNQAKFSHQFFHQNMSAPVQMLKITGNRQEQL